MRPLILTRPEAECRRIAEHLGAVSAWIWPTYTFQPSASAQSVRARLQALEHDDCVLFVSPTAVAFSRTYVEHWPEHITLACAGEATAAVVRRTWPDAARILFPTGGVEHSGSESLLSLMLESGLPKSLLILRAQSGREWLADELIKRGVPVEKLCVYERTPFVLSSQERQVLEEALPGPSPLIYLTSTDAVGVFQRSLRSVSGAFEWMARGVAFTIHPRCVEALKQVGFRDVRLIDSSPEAVAEALRSELLT